MEFESTSPSPQSLYLSSDESCTFRSVYLFKICFNIFPVSKLVSCTWSSAFRCSHQNTWWSLLTHKVYGTMQKKLSGCVTWRQIHT